MVIAALRWLKDRLMTTIGVWKVHTDDEPSDDAESLFSIVSFEAEASPSAADRNQQVVSAASPGSNDNRKSSFFYWLHNG